MFDTRTRLSYFACQQKNRLRLSNTVIDAVSFSFSGQLWGMFHSLDPREGPTCLRGVSPKEYACSMSNTSFLSHVFLSLFLLSLILLERLHGEQSWLLSGLGYRSTFRLWYWCPTRNRSRSSGGLGWIFFFSHLTSYRRKWLDNKLLLILNIFCCRETLNDLYFHLDSAGAIGGWYYFMNV